MDSACIKGIAMLSHLVWFKTMLANQTLVAKLLKITLIITDIDGSLTDGTVHYDALGEADRMYSPQDGYGIRMAIEQGIQVAFLSGNAGASINSRAKKLQIPDNLIILGSKDKTVAVKKLQETTGASSEQTLVFGDDVLDALVKHLDPKVCLAMPLNSIFYLQQLADCVTPNSAGRDGAFRLLVDLVLYIQGKHQTQELITQALEKSS